MIHLYEDREGTVLSRFLLESIAPGVDVRFVGGNRNFLSYIRKHEVRDKCTAYVDITIDNNETVYAYNELVISAEKHEAQVLPVPIISAEYDYIRMCRQLGLGIDTGLEEAALGIIGYHKKALEKIGINFHNFEQYCKWVTKCNMKACASLQGRVRLLEGACLCEHTLGDTCKELRLSEKADMYVSGRPVRPYDGYGSSSTQEVVHAVARIAAGINEAFGSVCRDKILIINENTYKEW